MSTSRAPQCPNCHTFKIESVSGKHAGMALLEFVFGVMLLPLFGFGLLLLGAAIIELTKLPLSRGEMLCKSCGWKGQKANLITNNGIYV
jgi:hypothetical protein